MNADASDLRATLRPRSLSCGTFCKPNCEFLLQSESSLLFSILLIRTMGSKLDVHDEKCVRRNDDCCTGQQMACIPGEEALSAAKITALSDKPD